MRGIIILQEKKKPSFVACLGNDTNRPKRGKQHRKERTNGGNCKTYLKKSKWLRRIVEYFGGQK